MVFMSSRRSFRLETKIGEIVEVVREEMKTGIATLLVGVRDEPIQKHEKKLQDHEGRIQRLEAAG